MNPRNLFVATVAVSLLIGLSSPMVLVVWGFYPVWMPEVLPPTRETIFYGASLIVSTGALLFSAIPAAVAERVFGASETTTGFVWLGGVTALFFAGFA